jgi:hypothetical protein
VTLLRFAATIIAFIFIAFDVLAGQSVTVQVETKEVSNGESSYLRVLCATDVALAGLTIPLKIGESNNISLDSVVFAVAVINSGLRMQSQITDENRTGFIYLLPRLQPPLATLPSPGGEICRLYFHVLASASPVFVPIDTFYVKHTEGQQVWYDQLTATDKYGVSVILPDFISGGISIERATTAAEDETTIPGLFALEQNFPNPFNPSTQIAFSLDRPEQVSIEVFDVVGNRVATLAQGRYPVGRHLISWDADRFPSGVYFSRLSSGSRTISRKMLLIK